MLSWEIKRYETHLVHLLFVSASALRAVRVGRLFAWLQEGSGSLLLLLPVCVARVGALVAADGRLLDGRHQLLVRVGDGCGPAVVQVANGGAVRVAQVWLRWQLELLAEGIADSGARQNSSVAAVARPKAVGHPPAVPAKLVAASEERRACLPLGLKEGPVVEAG